MSFKKEVSTMKEKLTDVKEFKGNTEHFITAKLHKGGKVYNITFDCRDNNVIVHEWYNMSRTELEESTRELKSYFVGLAA